MDILLLGYGKMGKAIERIALEKNNHIANRIGANNINEINTAKAAIAIEFSKPEAAFDNIRLCLERNIPVVCGTTGWLERRAEIEVLCEKTKGTFFYASNFSIGVNLFFKLNAHLAKLMNGFAEYEVSINETHHIHKKDAPSGTAITLAEDIVKHIDRKKKFVVEPSQQADEFSVHSFREDEVPGTHLVTYSSVVDSLEIKHTAHSREGFAQGAVAVAEWIVRENKKGVLSMDDYLKF
jgi:4-hydroxy-tetrahydrodipicolinate reductase